MASIEDLGANAPIHEAVVDLRCRLPASTSEADLNAAYEATLIADYPIRRSRTRWQGRFRFGGPPRDQFTEESISIDGFLYWSADETRCTQFRLDGFTFSQLHPYDNWTTLRNEARRTWEFFRERIRPVSVSRVALRYINHIWIPSGANLEDYFSEPPRIPKGLPQEVSGFSIELVIPKPDVGATAIVTTRSLDAKDVNRVKILLDVDVFRDDDFDIGGEEVWEYLERLRTYKNEIFFGSITDQTKSLLKGHS